MRGWGFLAQSLAARGPGPVAFAMAICEARRVADEEDVDRAAILARRRRFVAMAIGGLSGVGACHRGSASDAPAASVQALRTRAAAPLDGCELPEQGQPLGEDQKVELAKALYVRAKASVEAGELDCAVELMERTYELVPGKFSLAFEVGELAFALHDCDKAAMYLRHFLTYADPDKHPERFEHAQAMLDEMNEAGCITPPPPSPPDPYPRVCLNFAEPEPRRDPPPETKKDRREHQRARRQHQRYERRIKRKAARASRKAEHESKCKRRR